ncbi:MAG: thioredoxin family protein [Opitutaceae bacterium]|nr:thioredoxin family protein [Opitutaceae bacterium]
MMFRRLAVLILIGLSGLPGGAALFGAAAPSHVKAALVAADAGVQPGRPLTVALRLLHDPHWHTYWSNPGTGLPTTLEWKLPPGWSAGPIQWPAPILLKDKRGNIVGQGYEGELLLPVTLTPPADLKPGETIELSARADWLMCEEICIPGGATVKLRLPITAAAPTTDATWGEKIRATLAGLPRADAAWNARAVRTGKTITLTLTPAATGAGEPKTPHFFTADGLIAYDLPQTAKREASGAWVLNLPVASEGPADAKQLLGVVTADGGWLPGGALRGLSVAADLVAGAGGATATAIAGAKGAGDSPAVVAASLPSTLALAFLGGLILNLMPCVFPVLGIKILGFVNQAGQRRSAVVLHGVVFTLGVLLSFWALATVLAVLRAGGDQLGWGFQLQSPAFVYAVAVLMLVFALNLSGVFEFGLRATAVGGKLQAKDGYAGSFFTGILATVVATPCSAPFLAPALGTALAVSTVESFAIFTAIALGLSAPYLLLSIFPRAVKVLPRPGAWMETFKQFMAFPLYATVGALIWVLAAQLSEDGFLMALLSLVLIALAVWVYGRWAKPGAPRKRVRFGVAGLVVVGALGLWLGWPRAAIAAGSGAGGLPAVVWEPWSPEAVAKYRAEGRIIYVDFTARWCATCQTNKKLVFGSDEVLRTLVEKKVVTLKADWTNQDPRITAELARYGRSAVPFNVVWLPGRDTPSILPEILTPGVVIEALR